MGEVGVRPNCTLTLMLLRDPGHSVASVVLPYRVDWQI